MTVRSVCTLYGGRHKRQRQNYVRVPAGAVGYARGPFYSDDYAIEYYICKFHGLYVCCARSTFVIEPDP